ncbi:MAG: hypothetical protein ABJL44_11525 [Algibacter sp.]
MKYKSQKVAYWFFALSMLLFGLQIVYGFIMGFAHAGMDGLHSFIPFNTARAVHTNLLVVWLLSGFMGAAYYNTRRSATRISKCKTSLCIINKFSSSWSYSDCWIPF